MFTPVHNLTILLSLISIPLISQIITKKGKNFVEFVLKALAILILFFDPIYWIWEFNTFGELRLASTLPLYLCSLFWMMLPFAAFLKDGFIKHMALSNIATVGLISGSMGFVFNYHLDTWGVISFVGIRSLFYHYLMILGSTLIWGSRYYEPKAGDQWRAFVPVWVLLIPALILNLLYGYDYGYTAGGHGTPFTILSNLLPKALFLIILYGTFFLIVWALFYPKLKLTKKDECLNELT